MYCNNQYYYCIISSSLVQSVSVFRQRLVNTSLFVYFSRRLQLDKEMEEKRLEAEAKRQDAQRAHEIRLMSIMSQQMSSVLKVFPVA